MMSAPSWWKWEVTPGNVVSWALSLAAAVALFVWLQADVRALQKFDETVERRLTRAEERSENDRRDIGEIKGDIRVIRQILENQRSR